jgi:hypothetical protein
MPHLHWVTRRCNWPQLSRIFSENDKNFFSINLLPGLVGHQDGGWRSVPHTLCRLFQTCRRTEYSCLLKSTFTQASHDRGFKTWQTPATYPECIFCGRKYRCGSVYVECHMDPNISKATTGRMSHGPQHFEATFIAIQKFLWSKLLGYTA